jgi:hypothetical protein
METDPRYLLAGGFLNLFVAWSIWDDANKKTGGIFDFFFWLNVGVAASNAIRILKALWA